MKKKFLLFVLFFLILSYSSVGKSYALVAAYNHITSVIFCNDDPTDWEVKSYYYNSRTDAWITYGGVSEFFVNEGTGLANCPGKYEAFSFNDYKPDSGDLVRWHQACVDPTVSVNIKPVIYRFDGGIYYYATNIDVACHSIGYNGTAGEVYAGCYNLSYNSTDYGNIDEAAQCPYHDSNRSYCTRGGVTAYTTSCGASYCGGTNNCTYYNKTCSGTSCSHPSTAYSVNCGTQATCSPPEPTVTATPSCDTNNAGRISVSWSSVSYSDGVYDVRWRRSDTSTWTTDLDAPEPRVINGLSSSRTYYVQVRSHTTAGHHGPTAWGQDTAVTPDCDGPNIAISAFTFPGGNASGTGNASVTIVNNGASSTGTGFNVAVIRSVNGATCSTDETYTTSNPLSVTKVATTALGAGASRVLTIPINQPNNAGAYTATAMADADCVITERSESDNDRTDAYTLTANISGTVFIDANGNGIRDTGEAGYAGATTRVNAINYTTDANGFYRSAELVAGSYGSAVTVPAGYTATTPTLVNPITIGPNTTVNFGIRQQFSISGNVYVDANNNGIKDTGEVNYSGLTVTRTGTSSGTDVTDSTSTNYSFPGLGAGTYTVSITAPSGYTAPVTSQTTTLGPARTLNFRLVPRATVNIHVYNDNNGNGVEDVSETDSVGRTVTVTGGGAGTYTTNTSGNVALTNLVAGSSTITVTVPSGWTATTANPRTVSYPPTPLTVNFGLRPPAPVCSGGLTANPTTVIPGQTSALRAIGCTSPTGETLVYTWPAPDYGSTANVNSPNTTWTSPNPFWQQLNANPSVSVCNAGGGLCRSYGATITITPRFSAAGSVFVDDNKDRLLGAGESNYTAGITISPNPAGVSVTYPSAGTYVINNMPGGVYTVSYTSLPTGYIMTFPVNGPPPSFSIRVGNASTGGACSIGGSNSAACDANGNITALRYGITNSIPWIQSTGGDVTGSNISNPFGGGFNDQIPTGASCGSYASLVGSGGTPGIIHSGAGSANFGSGQASTNPYNWVVGGLTYPDVYIPSTAGVIKTSYNYMSSIAQQSGLTPVNIAGFCGGGGISNCALSSSLPNGIYISNGDLTLTGASYTFPANRNFVILVNGDLSIQTEVHVPVGSTALFSSSRDITVASTVGEVVTTSTRANVEGYYSADRDFKVLGINACPTSDRRLNVAGSIVVNAALGGGAFSYERDFCAGNLECPVFQIQERADFILNSPEFIKATRRVWREVAP